MSTFTLSTTLDQPHDEAVDATRRALATDAKQRLTAALAALTQED